jgi:hypothetical protein
MHILYPVLLSLALFEVIVQKRTNVPGMFAFTDMVTRGWWIAGDRRKAELQCGLL